MAKKYKTVDSRRHSRLKADYLIKYYLIDHPQHERVSNLKDISASGVRFWTQALLLEGALLRVRIWIPPLDRVVEALGRVVRVRSVRHGFFHYAAVSFIELRHDDQQALDQFVDHLSRTPESRFLIDRHPTVSRVPSVETAS